MTFEGDFMVGSLFAVPPFRASDLWNALSLLQSTGAERSLNSRWLPCPTLETVSSAEENCCSYPQMGLVPSLKNKHVFLDGTNAC